MGLTNCFGSSLYIAIDNVNYNKKHRRIIVEVGIYDDPSRKTHVAQKTYEFSGHQFYRRVLGFETNPPENPQVGDTWLVKPNATGDWEGRDSLFAVFLDDRLWHFWFHGRSESFYYMPDKKFYVYDPDAVKMNVVPPDQIQDSEWWDSWFASSMIFSDETNLYKQIYSCLKTFPGFENAVDC